MLFVKDRYKTENPDGAVAQLARASALQAECQEFDSPQLHQVYLSGRVGE